MKPPKTPLIIFSYNRPKHVSIALSSISQCKRLDECQVFVYCDGPKHTGDDENVAENRRVVKNWASKTGASVVERDVNLGLANSIISAVTELCNQYGRVIVIEDDFYVSPDFIDYMLQALDRYEDCPNIYQISGYMFPVKHPSSPDAFFLPFTTTWGWATWIRAWKMLDTDTNTAIKKLSDPSLRRKFDLDDTYAYTKMMEDRAQGKNNSWGILWWWSVFQQKGLVLHPRRSLVWVGGWDGTGTHGGSREAFQQKQIETFHQNQLASPIIWPSTEDFDLAPYQRIQKLLRKKKTRSWLHQFKKFVIRFIR